MDERIVAKIRKNATKEIWVVLTDYSGELRLDLRERFQGDDGGFLPTRRGVAVSISEVPALAAALEALVGASGLGTIATFGRTAKTEIRASICSYEGHSYAELRTFIKAGGSESEWKHGKGVTLNQALVPSLLSAVQDGIELANDGAASGRRRKANAIRAPATSGGSKTKRHS